MEELEKLASLFRTAIDLAVNASEFDNDSSFNRFPHGCCGDASDLLSQFLLENGIRTYYVCGTYRSDCPDNFQTHAWLLTKNQVIIDITGDQFKKRTGLLNYDKSVYVGKEDAFHNLFEIEDGDIHENTGLYSLGDICQPRLFELYQKINKYIPVD